MLRGPVDLAETHQRVPFPPPQSHAHYQFTLLLGLLLPKEQKAFRKRNWPLAGKGMVHQAAGRCGGRSRMRCSFQPPPRWSCHLCAPLMEMAEPAALAGGKVGP